jgi:proteic killer suppression protein
MALPGLRSHRLTGDRKGTWSVNVSGNWRITFEFSGPDVKDVNYDAIAAKQIFSVNLTCNRFSPAPFKQHLFGCAAQSAARKCDEAL